MNFKQLTLISILLSSVATYASAANVTWTGAANSDWNEATNWGLDAPIAAGGTEALIAQGGQDYRVHSFTNVGADTLMVNRAVEVEYLIVGGGASASVSRAASLPQPGAGAGGVLQGTITLSEAHHVVTVGAGGAPRTITDSDSFTLSGFAGSPSSLGDLVALGGGTSAAGNGASGGGGNWSNASFGLGTLGQGHDGGVGNIALPGNVRASGGGGGAGGAGGDAVDAGGNIIFAGNGGIGIKSSITGVEVGYAGGGAGEQRSGAAGSANGVGVDGGGTPSNDTAIGSGQPNTGGGAAGRRVDAPGQGHAGGSGIVVARYVIPAGFMPLATDNVIIDATGPTLGGASVNIARLFVGNSNGNTGTFSVQPAGSLTTTNEIHIGQDAGSAGTVTLSGSDALLHAGGQLRIGSEGTGTLTVSDGGTARSDGALRIASENGSIGTVNIGAAAGSTAAAAGTIDVGTVTFGTGTGEIVFNHTNSDYVFAADIVGDGTLRFLSGVTTLDSSNDAFTGTTEIRGGTLRVNRMITSLSATVENGGRFEGIGNIGDLIVNNGGTLAPGNSIGVTHVATATFNPGSVYEVELNAQGETDLLNASGTVTINGGAVEVIPFPDFSLGTPYTIIQAAGGILGGAFDQIITPGFLIGHLAYGANNVVLTLRGNPAAMQAQAQTPNQQAVATVSGNVQNTAMTALYSLPDAQSARAALDALSGEIHASLSAARIQGQQRIRTMALQRRADAEQTYGSGTLWVRGWGQEGRIQGNSNVARMKSRNGGAMVGLERQWDGSHLGAALGHGRSRAAIDDRASQARSDEHMVMAYGGTRLGQGLALKGGASWTRHEIRTQRDIAFGLFRDKSTADYNAQATQLFGRLSQRLGSEYSWFMPYGEAAYIHHRTSSFAEEGSAGLAGRSNTNRIGYTTLGLDGQHRIMLDGDAPFTLQGGIGWQRMIGRTHTNRQLSFRDHPQTDFTVQGSRLARNAMILHAGFSMGITAATDISVSYDANFSRRASSHTATARAAVRF